MAETGGGNEESAELWQLYGTWPGGQLCCVTTADGAEKPPTLLQLYVWTRKGRRQTFVPHVAVPPGPN